MNHPTLDALNLDTVTLEAIEDHVLLVTLNRPATANALNTQMGHDLYALWRTLATDPGAVRCLALRGSGERVFCAGGDLKERNAMDKTDWLRQHALFERMVDALIDLPIPVIAAVNGHAYGGGLELALLCDFIYAASHARFALTEVTLGIMPGAGGTQNLPRAIGERRAKEILLTGEAFTAHQALEWGLVNEVCESSDLLDRTLTTARTIAHNAPLAVRQIKKAIRFGSQMELKTALHFEVEAYNHLIETDDRYEGVRAFNEKRKPAFKGR